MKKWKIIYKKTGSETSNELEVYANTLDDARDVAYKIISKAQIIGIAEDIKTDSNEMLLG